MENEIIYLVLPLLALAALGSTGFTKKGFHFSINRRIAGRKGRLIGTAFVVPSAIGLATVFFLGSSAVRHTVMTLGVGIGLGVIWILSLRD